MPVIFNISIGVNISLISHDCCVICFPNWSNQKARHKETCGEGWFCFGKSDRVFDPPSLENLYPIDKINCIYYVKWVSMPCVNW